MADYKIKVGVELDANNFNTEIKKYTEKKQNVNVTAILDTQKVDDKIKKYRDNPKQIKLSSTLDMQKVDEKIKKYRDTPKQIKLLSTLDMQKVDDKIKSYNDNPKKIKVDAVLNDDSIKSQIDAFPKDKKIYLNAELDNSAISNAIKEFNNALSTASDRAKISVGVNPDFTNVETAISKYSTNKEIQIYPKLRIGEIAKQIKEYRTTHKDSLEKIYLRAEFKDDAIGTAISNYRTFHGDKLKLPIDLTLGNDKELDTKVTAKVAEKTSAYQSKPVEVPVVLKPATRGFDTKIRKPIEVDVVLKDGAINTALENPKNLSRIPVDVRLKPKDINEEIRKLKPLVTELLDVGVKLDETSANTAISTFKPTSLLDVGIDLNEASVNNAIAAFKPTALLNVSVDPNSGNNIDEKTGKKMAGAPLKVNVELDRDSINEQIKTFKAANRVNIGVKLDFASHKDGQKGVPQQIKEYKTKTKLKIGAELDKDSINQDIQAFKADKPIELGVTLDLESAKTELDKLKNELQKFGKIEIHFPNANADNKNNIDNNNGSVANFDNGISNATDNFVKFTASVRNADDVVDAMRGTLNGLGVDLNDVNAKNVTKDIQEMGIEVQKVVTTINGNTLRMSITGVQETKDGIKRVVTETREYEDAVTNTENVNKRFTQTFETSADAAKKFEKEVNDAFANVKNLTQQIGNLEIDLIGAEAKNDVRDIENITNRIAELRAELDRLNKAYSGHFTANQNNSINAIQSGIDYKKRQANNKVADKTDVNTVKELNNEMSKFVNLQSQISNMESKIKGLEIVGGKANEVAELRRQLEELENTYARLMQTFMKKLNANAGIMSMDDIVKFGDDIAAATKKAESEIKRLDAKFADTQANLAKGIKIKLSDGSFDNDLSNINNKFEKIKDKSVELRVAMDTVNAAFDRMRTAAVKGDDGIDELIKANQDYKNALKAVENQLNINARAEEKAAKNQKLIDDSRAFQSKIDAWLTKNSAAADKFGARLLELRAQAEKCDRTTLDHLEREFKQIDKEAEAAGKRMQTFGDRLKTQFQKYSSYLSVASVIMYATQAMRSMFEQVKLIDSAMTELKKVTNETDASYNQFLTNAAKRAKELGTTIDGLVASTADFARLGYGFEDSQKLAEVANIYAVVGDEIEGVEDATQSLVSTLAAFKDEMNGMSDSDFAMSIVDKMNEVSNNFAISSGGIGQALQRSASSMAAANNTLDETIAMITAANEVAQNPEKVGNAMKTMSMRIRGAKTELEEAGESTDGMAESTASLRAEMMALSGVDIMLDKNTFKSTYQIMDELSKKWEGLSDIAQASIIELVAGKHQGNVFASLMSNFDTAREALETSLTSSGSAMAEHAKWSESLEARLNKLSAAWQSLSQTFMNSDFLKTALDFVILLIEGLDKLIDTLGMLGTISLGVGIFGISKKFKEFKMLFDIFGSLPSELRSIKALFGDLGRTLIKTPIGIASAIGLVTTAISLVYNQYKKTKEAAAEARQEAIETSDAYLDAASSFEKAYIKYSGKSDLTSEEEAELEAAINGTVDALGDKSSALQSVVNSNNDYLASLEAIKKAELEAAKDAADTKKEKAAEELKEAAIGWESWDGSEVNIKVTGEAEGKAKEIAKNMNSEFVEAIINSQSRSPKAIEDVTLRLSGEASTEDIVKYYNFLKDYQKELKTAGLENTNVYKQVESAIGTMTESIEVYTDGVYEAVKASYQLSNGIPKTTKEYIKMRETILNDEKLDNFSLDKKMSVLNALDSEYSQLFDLTSAEAQARKFVGIIKGYGNGSKDGTNEIGTVETFLNMRTAVNNNDCTVGQYLSELDNINKITDNFTDEEKKQFNLAFGLDTDSVKEQYEDVYNYISRNYLEKLDVTGMNSFNAQEYKNAETERIQNLLDGLTSTELAAVVNIKGEIDWENTNSDEILKQIKEEANLIEALGFKADIEIDTTALEKLNEVLAESASAAGLSGESIDSLKSKYAKLDSYDPAKLFEATANGVKVNRDELVKLEKEYNNLTKTEVKEHLETLVGEYNDVTKEIDKCSNAAERAELIAKREGYADKIEELATYQAQLEGVTGAYQRWLNAQETPEDYEGYQAVATSREDIKDEIGRGFISNATKEYIDLLSGEDLVGKTIDDYAEAWENLDKKVGSTSYSIHDFFTVNDDGDITSTGIDRFFDGIQKDFEGEVYKFNKDTGEWYYDFSSENLQKIQDEWGIGIEAIELLLEAAASAGYNVDWDGILDNIDLDTSNFETLVSTAEKAQETFNKLKDVEDINLNFYTTNVEDATTEIEKARTVYFDLINKDGKINLEAKGASQMRVMLSTLLIQKQQLEDSNIVLNIDTSQLDKSQQDVADAINAVKEFREKYKNLEIAVTTGQGIDDAKAELSASMADLQSLGDEGVDIAAQLVLGEGASATMLQEKVDAAVALVESDDIKVGCKLDETSIGKLNSQILTNFTPEATVKITNIDESLVNEYTSTEKTADGTVKWKNDDSLVVEFQNASHEAEGTVNWANNTQNVQKSFSANGTVKWTSGNNVKVKVISEANGTANANGSTGRSFARGDWGIKGSGTALVGELGMETLVRGGRFYTIGDSGAEFIKYQQGDIIFNHKQTEELFKNGKVTSDGGRGKMFANGSAFADGSYPSSGRAFWGASAVISKLAQERLKEKESLKQKTKTETRVENNTVSTNVTTSFTPSATATESNWSKNKSVSSSSSSSSGSSSSSSNKDKTEESFDWIETAINRVERAIDNLDKKASNVYASWSSRNKALSDEISKVGDEIALQERARQGYLAEANRVGLSSSWISKVQSGAIDIDTITDENLAKKINDYKSWYEKALACEDAIEELKIKESDLYKQRFDNIITRYEGILDDIEHEKDLIEEYISQHENRNLSDFVAHDIKDYEVIAEYYQDLITQEQKNLIQLQKEKAELMAEFNSGNIKEGTEAWNEMQAKIHDVDLAIQQANTSIIEFGNDIAQSYKDAFDDIASQFDHALSVIEFKKNMIEEGISHSEAQGWLVSGEYYEALIDMEQDNLDKLQEKKSSLLSQLEKGVTADGKRIEMYSEAWWEMCEEIDSTTLAIEQSNNALLEYEQTLQQLSWETFDLLEEKISAVTEEVDFLIELLSNKKLYDDNGKLTDKGIATMGLHGQNYNTHMYQADLAAEEAEELKKQLEDDPFDTELEARYREMIALQQEHILAAEAEKDAIKDMVEEGINLELDALQEKIDLYNEALDSQKDLYDYQRKVKEQTEEIASLEKQMAAYQNDNSEEAKAKIQELKVSLEDAKADLEETEYDKYISDQKQMLDTLYLEYETILNTRLDNIDALISDMIIEINANASGINTTLQEAATSVGYTLSTEMQNIWTLATTQMQNDAAKRVEETTRVVNELVANGKLSHEDAERIIAELGKGESSGVTNATNIINQLVEDGKLSTSNADLLKTTMTTTGNEYKGVVTTYGNNFSNAQTTTNSALRIINTNLQSMITQLNSIAKTKVASAKVSSATTSKQATAGVNKTQPTKTQPAKSQPAKSEPTKTQPAKSGGDGVAKIGDKVKYVSGKYYYDPQGKDPLGSKNLGKEVYITNINKHSWATHPIHISTGNKLGKGDLGWLKKSQISGYAIGKEKFFDDEIAWTQEGNKKEFIVRPSDGAILTPIAKGDSVLNAVASKNIWDMANNPAEFIRDNLSFGATNVPNNNSNSQSVYQNFDKIVFNLPNVQNYEQLLSSMQKDKNFERLISSMTIDRLAGKSSLAKGKAIR